MTRGEIKTLARQWLDDEDGGYFTDSFMDAVINNAQREAQKRLLNAGEDYYTKCVYTMLVSGQDRYALPTDFMELYRLEYVTSGSGATASRQRVYPITRNEQDISRYQTSGDPYNYYLNKDTLQLVPVPNSAKRMDLEYAYRVADLTADAETPDVPADYHEYLAVMAARDGFLRDGRDMTPIERKLRYYDEMFRETAEQRRKDSPRMIVATGGGFGSV